MNSQISFYNSYKKSLLYVFVVLILLISSFALFSSISNANHTTSHTSSTVNQNDPASYVTCRWESAGGAKNYCYNGKQYVVNSFRCPANCTSGYESKKGRLSENLADRNNKEAPYNCNSNSHSRFPNRVIYSFSQVGIYSGNKLTNCSVDINNPGISGIYNSNNPATSPVGQYVGQGTSDVQNTSGGCYEWIRVEQKPNQCSNNKEYILSTWECRRTNDSPVNCSTYGSLRYALPDSKRFTVCTASTTGEAGSVTLTDGSTLPRVNYKVGDRVQGYGNVRDKICPNDNTDLVANPNVSSGDRDLGCRSGSGCVTSSPNSISIDWGRVNGGVRGNIGNYSHCVSGINCKKGGIDNWSPVVFNNSDIIKQYSGLLPNKEYLVAFKPLSAGGNNTWYYKVVKTQVSGATAPEPVREAEQPVTDAPTSQDTDLGCKAGTNCVVVTGNSITVDWAGVNYGANTNVGFKSYCTLGTNCKRGTGEGWSPTRGTGGGNRPAVYSGLSPNKQYAVAFSVDYSNWFYKIVSTSGSGSQQPTQTTQTEQSQNTQNTQSQNSSGSGNQASASPDTDLGCRTGTDCVTSTSSSITIDWSRVNSGSNTNVGFVSYCTLGTSCVRGAAENWSPTRGTGGGNSPSVYSGLSSNKQYLVAFSTDYVNWLYKIVSTT